MKSKSLRIPTGLALGIAALPLQAADGLPSAGSSLIQMLFGLGIVLACLFGALSLLRRLQVRTSGSSVNLKVLGATAVGPRERVVLVAVADKVLVLGVAQGRVNALHTLDAADMPAAEPSVPAPAGDFAARVRSFVERGKQGARDAR